MDICHHNRDHSRFPGYFKKSSQNNKGGEDIDHEIDDIKQRLYKLEKQSSTKEIEKRLQAIETIVVDSDYQLNMKFRRELEDNIDEHRCY